MKKWCLSKGLEDSGKCRYIPKNLKEESFWIFSDGYTIPIGFHISSKKSNLNIDVIAFDDYYYIVTIARDEINSDTKLIYRRDYVYKCDQLEGLFKLLNNLPFDVTKNKNKKWYSNILNFKSFNENRVWRYDEDELLKFLYDLDDVINELNEREKGSDCAWGLSYEFDDQNDTLVIDFGYSGYSDGFSRTSVVYYNHSMGTTKVVSTEDGSSPYGGSWSNKEVQEFDSYDDLIKDIRSHLGL